MRTRQFQISATLAFFSFQGPLKPGLKVFEHLKRKENIFPKCAVTVYLNKKLLDTVARYIAALNPVDHLFKKEILHSHPGQGPERICFARTRKGVFTSSGNITWPYRFAASCLALANATLQPTTPFWVPTSHPVCQTGGAPVFSTSI